MSLKFPDSLGFSGWSAPMRLECDIRDLEVIGAIPKELVGSFYRCGPDHQYPPFVKEDVFLNGDGMVFRYGFMGMHDPTRGGTQQGAGFGLPHNTLARIDHESGQTTGFYLGPSSAAQEPVFVPRSATSREGDGFLLAVINRLPEMRSDLVVIDAMNLEEGPVATVLLPMRLRYAFHGSWVPGSLSTLSLRRGLT